MAKATRVIPAKLKNDAIVEALAELRFVMPKVGVPELSFVRLAENPAWKEFEQRTLPAFNIPAFVRESDDNIRYQPYMEIVAPDKSHLIRIGPQVLSYHRLAPYVGWETFYGELKNTVDWMFSRMRDLVVQRIGLRYMNALRSDLHGIGSVVDLDLALTIAEEQLTGNVNINFTNTVSGNTLCTVRIATPEFIQGAIPPNTSVYVDVDVYTKARFGAASPSDVVAWLDQAHAVEKQNFFRLLADRTINQLRER